MIVRFRFKGSVMLYDKDNYWNVVVFTDKVHLGTMNVTENKNSQPLNSYSINPSQIACPQIFEIDRNENWNGKRTISSDNLNLFLNLSDQALHGSQFGRSNLRVKFDPSLQKSILIFKIPFGEVSVVNTHNCDYSIERRDDTSIKSVRSTGVVFCFEINFELTDKSELKFLTYPSLVNGKLVENPFDKLNQSGEKPDEIIILVDNDCGGEEGTDDFLNVYSWVQDINNGTDGKPIQYIAKKSDPNCIETKVFTSGLFRKGVSVEINEIVKFVNLSEKDGSVTSLELLHPKYGNCDPVIVDPPPA